MDIHGGATLLQVFDMPVAIRFYRDVLGFTIVGTYEPGEDCNWAWLKLNDAEVMLNTAYEKEHRPASPDPARIASHEDSCLFFGCKDLDAAYQHLRSHGVNLNQPKVAPYGMKQLWFSDPDGYGLCFQWPATKESSDHWAEEYGREPKATA
jgi:glyoxylase I family protein